MQKRCTVDLWTAGCAGSRLTAPARSPMDKPWTTLRVAHRLPTGRRLPTSSTALDPIRIKSGKVKTKTPAPALAYSTPMAVQTTGTTANLGDGLLQIWATHESSLIRVVDHADTQTAPSDEYFDTGILEIGEDDSHFDTIEFDKLPHARRNSIISAGRPKPTVIPYFDPCTRYGLDDEDLSDDQHKMIDRSIKLVKRYFASYTTTSTLSDSPTR